MKKKKESAEITSYNHNVPMLVELDERLLEHVSGGACPKLRSCTEYTVCGLDVDL